MPSKNYNMPRHSITLKTATEAIRLYRAQKQSFMKKAFHKKDILPNCETFERAAFDQLLKSDDCQAVRIYYGMKEDFQIHAIIVGVNSKNEDILPYENVSMERGALLTAPPPILEEATRCPDNCPPDSPLNNS